MLDAPTAGADLFAARTSADQPGGNEAEAVTGEPLRKLPYALGLAVQVILWMLLFLGITIAVLVGGELTEFRYVGF